MQPAAWAVGWAAALPCVGIQWGVSVALDVLVLKWCLHCLCRFAGLRRQAAVMWRKDVMAKAGRAQTKASLREGR